MSFQYVKFNTETNEIAAGPQEGMAGQEGWYSYIPLQNRGLRDPVAYSMVNQDGTPFVVQVLTGEAEEQSWQETRALSYPKIVEQLDKLYHDIESGTLDQTGQFFLSIHEVKATNPKT